MWLSDALSSKRVTKPYSEPIQTVLTTSPNRTWKQPKPHSDKDMSPFLLHRAHKKNSLRIKAFPFSNRTRNRTRTAPELLLFRLLFVCSFVPNFLGLSVSGLSCFSRTSQCPLFSMGCFPGDFQEENGPLRHSGKRPIKVGKRPIKEGKRPISTNVQFRAPHHPRGPKDQKNSRFRSRLKISIENEIFERATHRSPIFVGEIETSRLKFSSEIKFFDRD